MTENVSPLRYVEQMNALALLEEVARGAVGADVAAVHLARDPRVVMEALGVAMGLLGSALDAAPGKTVHQHLRDARRAMEARGIDAP